MATRTVGWARAFASVLLCAPTVSAAAVDVEQLIRDLATQNVTPTLLDYEIESFPANLKQLIAEPDISREVMEAYSPALDPLIRANLVLIVAVRLDRDPEELKPQDWGEFFLARLDDESPWVRMEAARAFSRLRYSRAGSKLATVVEMDETSVALVAAIALALYTQQPMFILAGEAGRRDVLEKLRELGVDFEAEINDAGWRPVTFAAAEGRLQTTRFLLELGANANAANDLGRTGLMFASFYGYTDIAEALLAAGADPNIVPTDEDGFPALIVAAQGGHAAIVALLLQNGADRDIEDNAGRTALDWALANEHDEVAEILRARGRVGN
jgi:hypothetical protein